MEQKRKHKPHLDRVIVKPIPSEGQTKSGLIIPDTAKEKSNYGTVIEAGPGIPGKVTMTAKTGDVVLYGKFNGTEIEQDGDKLVILRDHEILAFIHINDEK